MMRVWWWWWLMLVLSSGHQAYITIIVGMMGHGCWPSDTNGAGANIFHFNLISLYNWVGSRPAVTIYQGLIGYQCYALHARGHGPDEVTTGRLVGAGAGLPLVDICWGGIWLVRKWDRRSCCGLWVTETNFCAINSNSLPLIQTAAVLLEPLHSPSIVKLRSWNLVNLPLR